MSKPEPTLSDLSERVHLLMTAMNQMGEHLQVLEYKEARARTDLDVTLTVQYSHLKTYVRRLDERMEDLHRRVMDLELWNSRDKTGDTPWGPRTRTKRPEK